MLTRRSGLRPGKPLRRGKGLRSSSALKTVATLRRSQPKHAAPRDTGPDSKTRAMVCEREHNLCASCGRYVPPGSWRSIQHRVARGQGGGNDLFNLILLCGSATSEGCHRRCEQRDREMQARGYWLESWQDPAAEPVMLFSEHGSGITAWLTADGQYSFEPPQEVA